MESIKGTVTDRTSFNITIDGNKYGAFKGKGLEDIQIGDAVQLLWDFDKTGVYRNIKGTPKIISKASGTSGPVFIAAAKPSWTPAPKNTLGIELGHAANLAMDMTLRAHEPNDVGTPNFYKFFAAHTEKVFQIMKKLREAHERGDVPTPVDALKSLDEPEF